MENEELKAIVTIGVTFAGVFAIAGLTIKGGSNLFNYIDDTIKYNRYNEAIKEYRQCAQKYQDELSVQTYCGEYPPSTMLI